MTGFCYNCDPKIAEIPPPEPADLLMNFAHGVIINSDRNWTTTPPDVSDDEFVKSTRCPAKITSVCINFIPHHHPICMISNEKCPPFHYHIPPTNAFTPTICTILVKNCFLILREPTLKINDSSMVTCEILGCLVFPKLIRHLLVHL